jgi:hypothetical protein
LLSNNFISSTCIVLRPPSISFDLGGMGSIDKAESKEILGGLKTIQVDDMKLFESNSWEYSEYPYVIENTKDISQYVEDNRDVAEEGDMVMAQWYNDPDYKYFKAELLGSALGLGYIDDKTNIMYLLEDAHHVIVIK